MTGLSPEARALLEAARRDSAPTDADRERAQRTLSAVLGPLPLPQAQPAPGTGPVMPPSSLAAKAVIVAVLVGAGAGGLLLWNLRCTPQERPRTVEPAVAMLASPQLVPVALPRPAEPPAGSPLPDPVPETRPPRARPAPPSPVFAPMDLREPELLPAPIPVPEPPAPAAPAGPKPAGGLEEELRLLRPAQLARDPARALELLDEHARRFPQGLLREQRIAARINALCALHRTDEAREEAARFLAESPQSLFASKVRDSCAGGR